jgi:hypothetical protein
MDARLIILTLCYAEIFNSPLTLLEIHSWLPLVKIKEKPLQITLDKLVKNQQIFHEDGYYGLKKRRFVSKKSVYDSKIRTAMVARKLLKHVPFIKLIAVSGSTAAGRPKISSDIDLFIICSHNTVWITRALCVFVLGVFKLKRGRRSVSVANTICLNMFLDIDNMAISPPNIYSARETLQIVPIFNKNQTYEKFLSQNSWAFKIFPNFNKAEITKARENTDHLTLLLLPLALIFYSLQYLYMRKRITKEIVSFNEIRFHPTDYQTLILAKFKQIIKGKNLELSASETKLFFGK